MFALALGAALLSQTADGVHRQALLEAKVEEVLAAKLSDEKAGQALLPYVWKGMNVRQLDDTLGRLDFGDPVFGGFGHLFWISYHRLRISVDMNGRDKAICAKSTLPNKNGK